MHQADLKFPENATTPFDTSYEGLKALLFLLLHQRQRYVIFNNLLRKLDSSCSIMKPIFARSMGTRPDFSSKCRGTPSNCQPVSLLQCYITAHLLWRITSGASRNMEPFVFVIAPCARYSASTKSQLHVAHEGTLKRGQSTQTSPSTMASGTE